MKQAVFITGFNNWGKTSIIRDLFDDRERFFQGWRYRIKGINSEFTVESHSNDDWGGQLWVDRILERIKNETAPDLNLLAALCPTMDIDNNFIDLLSGLPFSNYDKLHIILIEYKWEHHAKLIIDNIVKAGRRIPNVNFIIINADQNIILDEDRWDAKTNQIRQELARIFP